MSYIKSTTRLPLAIMAALICAYAAMVFTGIADTTLVNDDEFRTAERSREFLLTGDWSTVHLNFKPNFVKPPLQYWATALTLDWSDNKAFIPRFWSAVGGIFSLLAVAWLASLVARDSPNRLRVACLAVLFTLVNLAYIWSGRTALLDNWMIFFNTAAVAAVFAARDNPRYWWAMAVLVALGTWQKAPTAFGLVMVAIVLQAIWWDRSFLRRGTFWMAMLLAIGLTLAWPLSQYLMHGQAFIDRFFVHEMVRRTGWILSRREKHHEGIYLLLLWQTWGFVGIAALACTLLAVIRKPFRQRYELVVLAILVLGILVYISAMHNRSLRYVVYIVPMMAVILAWFIGSHVRPRLIAPAVLALTVMSWFTIPTVYTGEFDENDPINFQITRDLGKHYRPGEIPVFFKRRTTIQTEELLYHADLPTRVYVIKHEFPGESPNGYRGLAQETCWNLVRTLFPDAREQSRHRGIIHWYASTSNPAEYSRAIRCDKLDGDWRELVGQ